MVAASYEVAAAWATPDDLVAPCCPGESTNPDLLIEALMGASTILYNLTGKLWFGESEDTVRPTGEYVAGSSWAPFVGSFDGYGAAGYDMWPGMWGSCGCGRTNVGCHSVSEIILPGYPVVEVTEVVIDGVVLDASHYRIQDRRRLLYVPQTGETRQGWPCCQDVTLDTSEADTWAVTYVWGVAPPRWWQRLAAVLGCELYQSMIPELAHGCRLPKRIQSITRQGVTVAILDSFDVFRNGLTGIPEIDMAISALKTGNADNGARVVVPGRSPGFRRDQP